MATPDVQAETAQMDNKDLSLVTITTETQPDLPKEELVPVQSREELLNTAVKFLKNPKVQSSPLESKRLFLKKKGLTDIEVEHALLLAGVTNNVIPEQRIVPTAEPISYMFTPRARDFSLVTVVICGATYGIYQLYKNIVASFFSSEPSEDDKVKTLEKKVEELQSNVNQLLVNFSYSLKDIHKNIADNQIKLQELLTLVQNNQGFQKLKDNQQFQDMKTEISSIKGLLLSRHSFPAPPVFQGLPAWQLQGGTASGSESDEKRALEGADNDKQSSPENSITTGNSRTWELVNEDSEEADTEVNSSGV